MYKLLTRSLAKSNRSLTKFTDIYKKISNASHDATTKPQMKKSSTDPKLAEAKSQTSCKKFEVTLKTSKTFTSSSFRKTGLKLLKRCLFPEKCNETVKIVMFSTSSSKYFYSSTINQSKDNKKKYFKNQKALDTYKKAVEQCMKIKFNKYRIDNASNKVRWTTEPFNKTTHPKEVEIITGKKNLEITPKPKKADSQALFSPRKSTSVKEIKQKIIRSEKRKKTPSRNNKKKFEIVYPTHVIKHKLGLLTSYRIDRSIKGKIEKMSMKKKKLEKVHKPDTVNTVEVIPFKQKLNVDLMNIIKAGKRVRDRVVEDRAQTDEALRHLIRQHPMVKKASKTAKMSINKKYNVILLKNQAKLQLRMVKATDLEQEEKAPAEEQQERTIIEDNEKKIIDNDKKPDTLLLFQNTEATPKITQHPMTTTNFQDNLEEKLRYPKKILVDKNDSYNINEICLKTRDNYVAYVDEVGDTNENTSTNHEKYTTKDKNDTKTQDEEREIKNDTIVDIKKKLEDILKARKALEDETAANQKMFRSSNKINPAHSLMEYLKKLNELKDQTSLERSSLKPLTKPSSMVKNLDKKILTVVEKNKTKVEDNLKEMPSGNVTNSKNQHRTETDEDKQALSKDTEKQAVEEQLKTVTKTNVVNGTLENADDKSNSLGNLGATNEMDGDRSKPLYEKLLERDRQQISASERKRYKLIPDEKVLKRKAEAKRKVIVSKVKSNKDSVTNIKSKYLLENFKTAAPEETLENHLGLSMAKKKIGQILKGYIPKERTEEVVSHQQVSHKNQEDLGKQNNATLQEKAKHTNCLEKVTSKSPGIKSVIPSRDTIQQSISLKNPSSEKIRTAESKKEPSVDANDTGNIQKHPKVNYNYKEKLKNLLEPANQYLEKLREAGENQMKSLEQLKTQFKSHLSENIGKSLMMKNVMEPNEKLKDIPAKKTLGGEVLEKVLKNDDEVVRDDGKQSEATEVPPLENSVEKSKEGTVRTHPDQELMSENLEENVNHKDRGGAIRMKETYSQSKQDDNQVVKDGEDQSEAIEVQPGGNSIDKSKKGTAAAKVRSHPDQELMFENIEENVNDKDQGGVIIMKATYSQNKHSSGQLEECSTTDMKPETSKDIQVGAKDNNHEKTKEMINKEATGADLEKKQTKTSEKETFLYNLKAQNNEEDNKETNVVLEAKEDDNKVSPTVETKFIDEEKFISISSSNNTNTVLESPTDFLHLHCKGEEKNSDTRKEESKTMIIVMEPSFVKDTLKQLHDPSKNVIENHSALDGRRSLSFRQLLEGDSETTTTKKSPRRHVPEASHDFVFLHNNRIRRETPPPPPPQKRDNNSKKDTPKSKTDLVLPPPRSHDTPKRVEGKSQATLYPFKDTSPTESKPKAPVKEVEMKPSDSSEKKNSIIEQPLKPKPDQNWLTIFACNENVKIAYKDGADANLIKQSDEMRLDEENIRQKEAKDAKLEQERVKEEVLHNVSNLKSLKESQCNEEGGKQKHEISESNIIGSTETIEKRAILHLSNESQTKKSGNSVESTLPVPIWTPPPPSSLQKTTQKGKTFIIDRASTVENSREYGKHRQKSTMELQAATGNPEFLKGKKWPPKQLKLKLPCNEKRANESKEQPKLSRKKVWCLSNQNNGQQRLESPENHLHTKLESESQKETKSKRYVSNHEDNVNRMVKPAGKCSLEDSVKTQEKNNISTLKPNSALLKMFLLDENDGIKESIQQKDRNKSFRRSASTVTEAERKPLMKSEKLQDKSLEENKKQSSKSSEFSRKRVWVPTTQSKSVRNRLDFFEKNDHPKLISPQKQPRSSTAANCLEENLKKCKSTKPGSTNLLSLEEVRKTNSQLLKMFLLEENEHFEKKSDDRAAKMQNKQNIEGVLSGIQISIRTKKEEDHMRGIESSTKQLTKSLDSSTITQTQKTNQMGGKVVPANQNRIRQPSRKLKRISRSLEDLNRSEKSTGSFSFHFKEVNVTNLKSESATRLKKFGSPKSTEKTRIKNAKSLEELNKMARNNNCFSLFFEKVKSKGTGSENLKMVEKKQRNMPNSVKVVLTLPKISKGNLEVQEGMKKSEVFLKKEFEKMAKVLNDKKSSNKLAIKSLSIEERSKVSRGSNEASVGGKVGVKKLRKSPIVILKVTLPREPSFPVTLKAEEEERKPKDRVLPDTENAKLAGNKKGLKDFEESQESQRDEENYNRRTVISKGKQGKKLNERESRVRSTKAVIEKTLPVYHPVLESEKMEATMKECCNRFQIPPRTMTEIFFSQPKFDVNTLTNDRKQKVVSLPKKHEHNLGKYQHPKITILEASKSNNETERDKEHFLPALAQKGKQISNEPLSEEVLKLRYELLKRLHEEFLKQGNNTLGDFKEKNDNRSVFEFKLEETDVEKNKVSEQEKDILKNNTEMLIKKLIEKDMREKTDDPNKPKGGK